MCAFSLQASKLNWVAFSSNEASVHSGRAFLLHTPTESLKHPFHHPWRGSPLSASYHFISSACGKAHRSVSGHHARNTLPPRQECMPGDKDRAYFHSISRCPWFTILNASLRTLHRISLRGPQKGPNFILNIIYIIFQEKRNF